MNTFGEYVTRVPNVASRRRAASASSSSRGECSRCSTSRHECDTSGSPEPLPSLAELYRSAPADFVATRDRLVRELKAAGDTDAARTLAKRKKPTRAGTRGEHAGPRTPRRARRRYLDLAADMRAAQIAAARDDARARRARGLAIESAATSSGRCSPRVPTTATKSSGRSRPRSSTPRSPTPSARGHSSASPTRRAASTRSRPTSATCPRNRASAPPTGAATKQCRSSTTRSPRPNRSVDARTAAWTRARAALDEAERHANAAARRLDKLREQRAAATTAHDERRNARVGASGGGGCCAARATARRRRPDRRG